MLAFAPLASAPLAALPDFEVGVTGVVGQGLVGTVTVNAAANTSVTGLAGTTALGTTTFVGTVNTPQMASLLRPR